MAAEGSNDARHRELEECEARLAAALLEIEGFRERERILTGQVAILEGKVHQWETIDAAAQELKAAANGLHGTQSLPVRGAGAPEGSPIREKPPLARARSTESLASSNVAQWTPDLTTLCTAENEHIVYLRTRARGLVRWCDASTELLEL
mmetsp:Transcript_62446/g.197870  ORF Transcript_62446/g.197870 Transcript_62446/m.197870 type:complete len:150 (+) Transcript_62446:204-653(+)